MLERIRAGVAEGAALSAGRGHGSKRRSGPGKVLCSGINYKGHAEENPNAKMPTEPFFFAKLPTSVVGPDVPVVKPAQHRADGLRGRVLGGDRQAAAQGRAKPTVMPAIFGYTLLNDISARDVQFKDNQITIGKNFAGFAPIGPCIVTADALPHPDQVALKTRLNGKTLQDGSTSDWLFSLPRLISFLSQLHPARARRHRHDRNAGRRRRLPEAADVHEGRRRRRDRGRRHRRPAEPRSSRDSDGGTDDPRSGSIGCGFFAQNHLHAWKELAPRAPCSPPSATSTPAKAEAAGRAFGVAVLHRRRRDARGERLDAVDIVTRHDTHRALCRAGDCARRRHDRAEAVRTELGRLRRHRRGGRHGRRLARGAREFPLPGADAPCARASSTAARSARRAGRASASAPASMSIATQPYFYDEERLAIADVGIHMLDLARFFMGEVERISCETQRRNPKVRAEDTATMLLRHESGAVSVVECTYEARRAARPLPGNAGRDRGRARLDHR